MSELNQLIGFLEEQLTVSEPTPDYTRHNQEIITYIEYLKLMKQPQLNENQQIVLDWLKEKYTVTNIEPIELFWRLRVNSIKPDYRYRPVYRSYRYMSKTGQLQVLQAFSRWAIEQEEQR